MVPGTQPPHEPPFQPPSRRGSGRKNRLLLYGLFVFAACWLQIVANAFAYFWAHRNDPRGNGSRFPLRLRPRSSREDRSGSEGEDSPRSGEQQGLQLQTQLQQARLQAPEEPPAGASLRAELEDLRNRLERVREGLEREIAEKERSDPSFYWVDAADPGQNRGFKDPSNANGGGGRVFVPFTIRDAQRTVPVQIPHGFHVFDFIDLHASGEDRNQTIASSPGASLFHNGHLVPPRGRNNNDNENDSENENENAEKEEDCRGYSKKCYRAKFLRVADYLLSLERRSEGVEYYYFYMESDNDLCVPLEEIRDLAFRCERYFVSTGIGASGWIVKSRFLRDLVGFWRTLVVEGDAAGELTPEERLEPDAVAALLLKRKRDWSVTRRYLTSHSILVGTTEDADSIAALYEPDPEFSSREPEQTLGGKKKKTKDKGVLMRPARYLPRCMEPHRGIWPVGRNNNNNNNNIDNNANDNGDGDKSDKVDMYHWEFFDYSACPDSDIFPCHEGQLEELAKTDPYYLRHEAVA